MQRRRGRSIGVEDDGSDADGSALMAVAVSLPVAPAHLLDRLGFRDVVRVRVLAARRTSYSVPGPLTPLYMALYSGDPPTIKGWAPPIRARIRGLIDRWVY